MTTTVRATPVVRAKVRRSVAKSAISSSVARRSPGTGPPGRMCSSAAASSPWTAVGSQGGSTPWAASSSARLGRGWSPCRGRRRRGRPGPAGRSRRRGRLGDHAGGRQQSCRQRRAARHRRRGDRTAGSDEPHAGPGLVGRGHGILRHGAASLSVECVVRQVDARPGCRAGLCGGVALRRLSSGRRADSHRPRASGAGHSEAPPVAGVRDRRGLAGGVRGTPPAGVSG